MRQRNKRPDSLFLHCWLGPIHLEAPASPNSNIDTFIVFKKAQGNRRNLFFFSCLESGCFAHCDTLPTGQLFPVDKTQPVVLRPQAETVLCNRPPGLPVSHPGE